MHKEERVQDCTLVSERYERSLVTSVSQGLETTSISTTAVVTRSGNNEFGQVIPWQRGNVESLYSQNLGIPFFSFSFLKERC